MFHVNGFEVTAPWAKVTAGAFGPTSMCQPLRPATLSVERRERMFNRVSGSPRFNLEQWIQAQEI